MVPRVLSFYGGRSKSDADADANNQYNQYQPPYISNQSDSYSQYYSPNSRSNSNSSHQASQDKDQHQQHPQNTLKTHKKSFSSISFNRRNSGIYSKRDSLGPEPNKRHSLVTLSPEAAPQPFDHTKLPRSNSTATNNNMDITQRRTSFRANSMSSEMSYAPPMDFPKETPPEMMPILTLLNAHENREYSEGYLMILNDLNSGMFFSMHTLKNCIMLTKIDGKPAADRRWIEAYGKLTGTVLSIWDASSLENANGEPTPVYINITDSTFKSIPLLPSPNGDLTNIVVLSTTLKNRYLLQFATPTLLHTWTAAMRLSQFEHTSLQEAYTGALLSSKGSQLNGIRTLLTETKFRHEDYVSVRFGSGMPWKKCWAVVSPSDVKKKRNLPPPCTIAFYEDKKKVKRPPLALITGSYAAYAVYPQSSLLINGSTMIKIEGKVAFNDVNGEKDASVFLMPEAHPGVPGFETLIRFLIPVLDTFHMYGRPQRLNADKADMRSLLFGMPSLPYTQYLEVNDVEMLVSLNSANNWTPYDWTRNIKDLMARKMSAGYKGTGKIKRPVSMRPVAKGRDRSISQPMPVDVRLANRSSVLDSVNERPSERQRPQSYAAYNSSSVASSNYEGTPVIRQAPPPPVNKVHSRSASTGADPNNLLSTVSASTQPISPLVANTPRFEPVQEHEPARHSGAYSTNSDSSHHVYRRPVSHAFEPDTESIPSALDASRRPVSDGGQARRYTTHEQQQYEQYGTSYENQNPYSAPGGYR